MPVTAEVLMDRDEYDYYTGALRMEGIKPINRFYAECLKDKAKSLGIPCYADRDRSVERSRKTRRNKAVTGGAS